MNSKKVTVLTPNGRRQVIPVTPSTTMLQILEGVCKKHNFDSNEYDLKHHKKILDPSAMFRFSGLPNNCLLEMVELTRKRDTEKSVLLCIQLEDGTRRQGSFSTSDKLSTILHTLCADRMGDHKHPVLIYMRKEIFGNELETTTLKTLGITGSAMIRLIDRNPEELRTQANVYTPIPKDVQLNSKEEVRISTENAEKTTDKMQSSSKHTEICKKNEENDKIKPTSFQLTSETLKDLKSKQDDINLKTGKEVKLMDTNEPGPSKKPEYDWGTGGRKMNDDSNNQIDVDENESNSEEDEMLEEPLVIELGERHAVIFSLAQAQKVADHLPDSFFDLTVDDLKLILKDLRKQASDNDEPLLTSKLREIQNQSRILTKMNKYKKCVIRVQFPDRLVLQGTFQITETLADVYDFVKEYLENSCIEFDLFTTPPKRLHDKEKTLIELDFVPTVILHFGANGSFIEDTCFLKAEYFNKLSTPNGAALAAAKSRGKVSRAASSSKENSQSQSPKGAIPKKPKQDSTEKSESKSESSGLIPKWFRPVKK